MSLLVELNPPESFGLEKLTFFLENVLNSPPDKYVRCGMEYCGLKNMKMLYINVNLDIIHEKYHLHFSIKTPSITLA